MFPVTLAVAKTRLRIPEVWRLCGLPGEPRKSCRCPFHDDRSPSFSMSSDGLLWNCFAGCGGGDAVDFLQRARGLSQPDACREFVLLAGSPSASVSRLKRPQHSFTAERSSAVQLSGVTPGTSAQWRALAVLRNLSPKAVALAARRGLLVFGEWKGRAAWFVTDTTRHNAQVRRMDGQPWLEIEGKKAWTICKPGNAKWPIGVRESAESSGIAFCEGGPDLLAAFHFINCEAREADCSAVAMLGGSLTIHADALPLFAGKRVRIYGHADASGAGSQAVERWATQLTRAGAEVDAFNFSGLCKTDGSPVKDLNDCTSICADDFEMNRELWGILP